MFSSLLSFKIKAKEKDGDMEEKRDERLTVCSLYSLSRQRTEIQLTCSLFYSKTKDGEMRMEGKKMVKRKKEEK